MTIKFFSLHVSTLLSRRKQLKQFISEIFLAQKKPLNSLAIVFCNDEYLLSINEKFLHHSDFTDILTFSLSKENEPITGEIYISIPRIVENSTVFSVKPEEELHRVIFHGILHLCGYTDKAPIEKKRMTAAEDHYLHLYFKNITNL